MIFDSLGVGEIGVVLALAVVLIKPKELGKVMREFTKLKRKALQIQSDVRAQLETITIESEAIEKQAKLKQDKAGLRTWARERVASVPASERAQAAEALAARVAEWHSFRNAKAVACFASNLDEIDTDPLLRRILAEGKTLLLPYITGEGAAAVMAMAPVKDLEKDLAEGAFGIREPRPEARTGEALQPDLILAPGLAFDLRGGRLGKGKGFYDRYLAGLSGLRAGVGYDVQITDKNLPLDPHDQLMDAVVTDKRTQVFSAPRFEAPRSEAPRFEDARPDPA
jgi:5-formyltetrahydrofolate cyclo-ligase